MPATIRVESGISAGTDFWIDRPVLRIGSDPQCDLCLPSTELSPHALTLEFRGGGYRVYNRGASPVSVGSAVVQPGGNAGWNAGQSLVLPGDLRLALSIDGDPRPAPRPDARPDDDFDAVDDLAVVAAPTAEAAAKKSSGTMMQLAIIGFCILGMAAFLTMRPSGDAAVAAERPTFDTIVESALAKDPTSAARRLLPRLQYAEAAVVRGNVPLALERFAKLRDRLVRIRDSLAEADRADAQQMLDYVEQQLSELQ